MHAQNLKYTKAYAVKSTSSNPFPNFIIKENQYSIIYSTSFQRYSVCMYDLEKNIWNNSLTFPCFVIFT